MERNVFAVGDWSRDVLPSRVISPFPPQIAKELDGFRTSSTPHRTLLTDTLGTAPARPGQTSIPALMRCESLIFVEIFHHFLLVFASLDGNWKALITITRPLDEREGTNAS